MQRRYGCEGNTVIITGLKGVYKNTVNRIIVPEKISGTPVKIIANNAFNGCTALEEVKLPYTVRVIGGWAFKDCALLKSLNGAASADVKNGAFEGCKSLPPEILIRDGDVARRLEQEARDKEIAEKRAKEEARLAAEEKAREEAEAALKQDINAAENGDAMAQCAMASRYRDGDGVTASADKAFEWWRKAAMQANIDAMYAVAQCYENGDGVEQDIDSAKEWYGKLARMGDERGKTALAAIMEREEAKRRAEEERIATGTVSGEQGFYYDKTQDGKGIVITGTRKEKFEVLKIVVTSSIKGKPVRAIGE